MSLRRVTAVETLNRLDGFDAIVDARSESEYAEDHLPGAVNWPVLDDEERHLVGTLYVQTSPLAARKLGAALVSRRIAAIVEAQVHDKPREWRPLVYCWRGGQRSGSLALVLAQIGFRTAQLQGGYKAFRARVRADLDALPARFTCRVLCGRTGSGKTRLLQALRDAGAQVLDLEGLARHRGSVLGGLPHEDQPTQKAFDTAVWHAMRAFDAQRPVFIESESRKIGALAVPEALLERMRGQGRVVMVTMPDGARVRLLLEEYGFFSQQLERFCAHMDTLVELRGRETVAHWKALARDGRWAEVFAELMHRHYDPLYLRSIQRNFAGIGAAREIVLRDGDAPALREAAAEMLSID